MGTGGVHYFSENLFLKKYVFFCTLNGLLHFFKKIFAPLGSILVDLLHTYVAQNDVAALKSVV